MQVSKRMVRDKVEAQLLDNCQVIDVQQRCPYTYVALETSYKNTIYATFGFSKVCWPDKWDAQKGIDIAISREIARLAKEILAKKFTEIQLIEPWPLKPQALWEKAYELV